MRLHAYFRSSATFRVRIALNLKAVGYDVVPVDLLNGEQRSDAYRAINPQGLVPALELDSGEVVTQSPAILEWLEERYPLPPLYPADPVARAHVRALCFNVACEIHPLDNLRVLTYLTDELRVGEEARLAWYHHWVRLGFDAIEPALAGPFCTGAKPSMADVYLVPQVYNAERFRMDLSAYPRIAAVYAHAVAQPAFAAAHPDRQVDAPRA